MTTTFTNTAKSSSSFANAAKSSASFANGTKHSASFAGGSKSTSVFAQIAKSLRAFGTFTFDEIGSYTFESVILSDGTQIKNVTFETLVDILWANQTKN